MPLIINRAGGNMIPNRRMPLTPRAAGDKETPYDPYTDSFETRPDDVYQAKQILMKAGNLPIELADIILDVAEYWVCTATTADYTNLPQRRLALQGRRNDENKFLLRTMPLGLTGWSSSDHEKWRNQAMPKELRAEWSIDTLRHFADDPKPTLEHPCRKIEFNIVSHDQGWGGIKADHGTFHGSWTWFEAGIERFDANAECAGDCLDCQQSSEKGVDLPTCSIRPVWPRIIKDSQVTVPMNNANGNAGDEDSGPITRYHHELHPTADHKIQCNKVATHDVQHHHVEWRFDDDLSPEELVQVGRGSGTGDGKFVRSLKLGDIVTIWGHARFSGWCNHIEKVEVKTYWAI
ncbi:uncharacterized protein BCR38DRAFT_426502 [Pseudomassariella vexata]|uniref:Uncharacterized protein n=1 Tax=Pseudomassariella vexata TaxID=1141098 RepID=A0A1Y2E7J9_9PEZI|nr:uncharacterized protein BCR38DRAFT_426502 [Pseudomassariella vexata]ORY67256.1 hypothetical protein BCR38DRAFT_426502 [Pseudomassariella vexata]